MSVGRSQATPTRLGAGSLAVAIGAVLATAIVSVSIGPVSLAPMRVFAELLDRLPLIDIESGLSDTHKVIVWQIRAPRVVLGLLVGSMLAGSGAAYQGVFRNPLADPYLLGIGAGGGLGATIAIVNNIGDAKGVFDAVPLAAFFGALVAVAASAGLGASAGRLSTPATLLLAGVAVSAFLTAIQTYIQQRNADTLRQVYTWILGRLSVAGWDSVALLFPYALVTGIILALAAGSLDVMAVGDDEATLLGITPKRVRWIVILAASLSTAAAVATSGLIGFVGLVVPHAIRLVRGVSNRVVVPLSLLLGGAFLCLADLGARTIQAPAELPIGVITAFVGAPFFLLILRTQTVTAR